MSDEYGSLIHDEWQVALGKVLELETRIKKLEAIAEAATYFYMTRSSLYSSLLREALQDGEYIQ